MNRHIASVHEGKKQFKCELCDHSFNQNAHMKTHVTSVHEGKKPFKLSPGDAFVIPPKMKTQYTEYTPELELLEVSLPGKFNTYY